jgi:ParB family chromosome partitioning protein
VAAKKTARRKPRKRPAEPTGLAPAEVAAPPPEKARREAEALVGEGAVVLATYRDPVGGKWLHLVAIDVERVEPTPYQREPSKTHVEKITRVIEKVGRFLDPIILCSAGGGRFWTPNGNHRLQALRALHARTAIGLLVPEPEIAHQILALNTEKGYNLRERSLGVARLLRTLAEGGADGGAAGAAWRSRTEASLSFELEEPALVTLGAAYEKRPRLSGGAYQSVLRRIDEFLEEKLPRALALRGERADQLLALDDAVSAAVAKLKERGFQSPYLKAFVVARVNFLRFVKGDPPPFAAALEKMEKTARRFNAEKISQADIARSGGPPEPEAAE